LIELGVETGIALVFVVSIVLLRLRPRSEINVDVFNVDEEPLSADLAEGPHR